MGRKKKEDYPTHFTANFLLYDGEHINYRHGVYTTIENDVQTYSFNDAYGCVETKSIGQTIRIQTGCYEELNNIELDPTTMKRIAVYNKQQECKRLDKEIKEKQEKIKELDDLLKDKEKRWDKVKKYIKNIYNISTEDIESYDDDEYYDY